ncbi:S1/P1 nuclease [Arenibacter sp. BSSL-BM3]|uniref:S1/P1 nuclease n=1 Tax=Arenibacter arenosicollis TaxID=2762274 RepID=A0ABR7QT45_9FLAO|nr:S1/P1 nuclease [Arenibacter arenosicollis]MBC8770350.1 S1/P1 nuclease [Arenibacter arenosicollis]
MKKIIALCFLMLQFGYGNNLEWSKTGHRTIGEVAQQHLSRKAKRAINSLLNGEGLALASNYADEIKADRSYAKFGPWHYVNFPADKKYTEVQPSGEGDIVKGIEKCIEIVKDKNSSAVDKKFYLKMLIHLIGDLHQPMHVGRLEDKGGNDIHLQWFGRGTNLHRLWDSNMIDDYGMSYMELANNLPRLNKSEIKNIQHGNLYDWVEESQDVANELYLSVEEGEKLGYAYSYKYWETVEQQLQKGGLRLAKVLNDLFS